MSATNLKALQTDLLEAEKVARELRAHRNAAIVDAAAGGMTQKDIATALGVKQASVSEILARAAKAAQS